MLCEPGSVWKVFQLVQANFEQFDSGPVTWGGLTATQAVSCVVGGLTAWGRRSNRPGKSEQFFLCVAFPCCIAALAQGECALAQGSLHMCRGSSLWCSSFGSVVCALCLSMVLSRMCRAVALA
jgi:hypothetical protein